VRRAWWLASAGVLAVTLPLLAVAEPSNGDAGARQEAGKQPSEVIRITDRLAQNQKLEVTNSTFSHSTFENCRAEGVTFRNVAMLRLSFENANLSDMEIKGAQLGGALFRHIGMPPPDHPGHKEGAEQRPLRFEECDLHGTTITRSDLSGVTITGCKMREMTIDGISVEDLLAAYREKHGKQTRERNAR
jgi:uncharacterized protein YjbI with pentapeptide repeats